MAFHFIFSSVILAKEKNKVFAKEVKRVAKA
jgi:hypothetical protein